MKKRLLAVVMSLVLAMGLVACGSKEAVSDKVSLEDLQAQINELKAENEELKAQLEEKEEQAEVAEETWTDDTIIAFANAEMADAVRQITGIYDRDITAGDVKGITKIEYDIDEYGYGKTEWEGGLEPLKYFTGLVELNIISDCVDLEPIKNITNLQSLEITYCNNLVDISAISNLTNLQSLKITDCSNLADINAISNLTNLQSLEIKNCINLVDINAISNLTNLQLLYIVINSGLTEFKFPSGLSHLSVIVAGELDLNGLSDATNLKRLTINCNEFVGAEALENTENVEILCLEGDGIQSLEFISNYTSLVDLYVESSTLNIEESLPYLEKYENVWRDGENGIRIMEKGSSRTETETCYKLW